MCRYVYAPQYSLDLRRRPLSKPRLLRHPAVKTSNIDTLAEFPAHQKTLQDLRSRLDDWIETYNDQGETPEHPANIATSAQDMHSRNLDRLKAQHGITGEVSPEEYMEIWEKRLLG